jgi:general secretion pathway protein D
MRKHPLHPCQRRSSAPAIALLALLAGSVLPLPVQAGSGMLGDPSLAGLPAVAAREIARREEARQQVLIMVADGDKLFAQGDAAAAVNKYRDALNALPIAPATDELRREIGRKFGVAAVARARELAAEGNYVEARRLLEETLLPSRDETNRAARVLLAQLDDPDRFQVARTPEHTEKVREVEKRLAAGESSYLLGRYDDAEREFNSALVVDPYNKAARSFLERIERTRIDYYGVAYSHTRSKMIRMVDEAWESKPPQTVVDPDLIPGGPRGDEIDLRAENQRKLQTIIIPSVNFQGTTLAEAIEFLRLRSSQHDTTPNQPPERRGLNLLIRSARTVAGEGSYGEKQIDELNLRNVPIGEVLRYLCEMTGMRVRVEQFAVVLVPLSEGDVDLYSRTFRVPPDFIPPEGDEGGGAVVDDPFAPAGGGGGGSLRKSRNAKEYLESLGVPFPENASANFDKRNSILSVRNTPQAMELIEQIVEDSLNKQPKQVNIETKFVEVQQRNGKELGFDWLIGPGVLNDGKGLVWSGGTAGNGVPSSVGNYPLIDPISSIGGGEPLPLGRNPVTSGLRSGDFAVTRNAIDSILNTSIADVGADAVAPGVLALSGLLTEPQFQVVLRALDQKKGTDLLSAPSVTTKSGLLAKIEIIREFIYPEEYDPPELPNQVGTFQGGGGGGIPGIPDQVGQVSGFPVTPATPTAFVMKPVGVTLEVDPTVSPSGYTIDLTLKPEVVEFEGFINYGNPITSPAIDGLGRPTQIVITENRIEQPVFSTRRVNTQVTVWDGQTVAIGGLIREDVQDIEDKVPLLGDIPIFGRLFKTTSENRFKRNLMVFVTANLIDPSGRKVREVRDGAAPVPGAGVTNPGTPLPPVGGELFEGAGDLPTL